LLAWWGDPLRRTSLCFAITRPGEGGLRPDLLGCGILARGLAQLSCPTCHERYVVAWSCKGRAFCPSCGGRRTNAGALTLVDHVLPEVPLRQFVVTVPFPLRFPLAFDGELLSQVVRLFIDTVAGGVSQRYARPHAGRDRTQGGRARDRRDHNRARADH
jgi:hypothetical protein